MLKEHEQHFFNHFYQLGHININFFWILEMVLEEQVLVSALNEMIGEM